MADAQTAASPPADMDAWDAVETADRVRRREVRADDVIDAALARAERARSLGAIVVSTDGRARAAASGATGPLAGVPTYIKDLSQLRGVPTAWGSSAGGVFISKRSDKFVARFEETGVVVLGKSATPEFGLTATTEPIGRPPCRNPWDPTRSSGGSSGGAASLVASGVVPIAHASDGGGSIRVPAACCGLVGLKPSRFRMDMEGSNLLPINVAVDGVVTRTVRDTVAFYEAMESKHRPKRVEPVGPIAPHPTRTLRIGVYVEAPTGSDVHPETREASLAAGRLCASLGHQVDEIPCPFAGQVIEDFLQYWGFVAWIQKRTAWFMLHRGFESGKLEPWTHGLAASFSSQLRASAAATRRLRGFGRTYAKVMEAYDVLICPTVGHPAPPLGYLATDLPIQTVFDRLRAYVPFTPIQNAAGAPAISLPLGRTSDGLPIGVQLAAAHGADSLLLELARSIEVAQPWPLTAPLTAWAPGRANGAASRAGAA